MKRFLIYMLVFLMATFNVMPSLAAEDYPPPGNNKGTIGNVRNGNAWSLGMFNKFEMEEISAPSGDPGTNHGWIYTKDKAGASALYFENDAGSVVELGTAATPTFDTVADPAADVTLVYGDNETDLRTFADTNEDMFTIQGIGAFGDVSVVRIEQITGNPTDGTVLEVVAADANVDPLVVSASGNANALVVGQNTGVVTIAGVAEGTTALSITAGDIALTDGDLMVNGGDATFAEDVTITGNLIGGTGLINYTNFDVDAAGNVTAVDGTFSGNVSVTGTFQQDAITAATAATTITVDGLGTGGVTVGGTSTGTITLGGGSTLVNLPSTVDLVLAGGDITATDTANADMVTFTNNTMTTADLLTLSASGTRTSNNVIAITDGTTTASTVAITANTQTSGHGIAYGNTGAGLTGAAYYAAITDGAGFTGYYFQGYDGAANDFTVGRYGATVIGGNASTNVLTVTTGDVQVDDGKIEVSTDEDDSSSIKRNQGTTTSPVFEIEETNTAADNAALFIDQNATTAASYGMEIDSDGGTSIHLMSNTAAGDHVLIDVADAWTGQAIVIDAGPWVGTAGEGAGFSFTSDAAATQEAGSVIRIDLNGTGADAAAIDGKGLYIEDEGAATVGSYLVKLDTLANTALHISNAGAAADGIKIDVANSYTGQGFVADLGPWLGTSGEGFISLTSDNAATVPAGQFLRFRQQGTGQHAAAIDGTLIYLEDDAVAPAAGTSYVMNIDATNIEAIHVDTGKVLVDETVTATGGISTGSAADSLLKTDTVELSNADIKALRATPKDLVAAPAAGYVLEFVSAVLILDYGSEVLTESADNMVIQFGSGADVSAAIESTGFIDAAADTIYMVKAADLAGTASASIAADELELFNTGDGEFAGNASNDTTMTVKITYRVHATGL